MGRAVTLKDVARALNLSASTVARALADSSQISHGTKARVRHTAGELGYVVHSAARAMRLGHSTLIGLIIPDVKNEFYGTLAKALAQCCDAAGFQLVLAITEDDAESELRQVRALSEARAAGIVIVPSPTPRRETLALLSRAPCAELIRRLDGFTGAWFGIDEELALRQATRHLIDLGHRRIAYVGGTPNLSTGRSRFAGYEQAFAEAKLPLLRELVYVGRPRAAFAAQMFERLWSAPARPTAIVTAGARLTAGVLEAVTRLAVRVPEEISVVGYGDVPVWGMGLTTISLPVRDIALACGEYLLRRIREGDRDVDESHSAPYHAIHAPTLTVRASTAPPRH
jgi:DNA-binding LacI/PurR family transcriptional regulator